LERKFGKRRRRRVGAGRRSPLREIVSIHIKDHGNVFRERGFLEDILHVVGKGAGFVGTQGDLETKLIVGFDEGAG
jgi:hypothetical protein